MATKFDELSEQLKAAVSWQAKESAAKLAQDKPMALASAITSESSINNRKEELARFGDVEEIAAMYKAAKNANNLPRPEGVDAFALSPGLKPVLAGNSVKGFAR